MARARATSATSGSHVSLPLYDEERLVLVTPEAETSMITRHVGVGWLFFFYPLKEACQMIRLLSHP